MLVDLVVGGKLFVNMLSLLDVVVVVVVVGCTGPDGLGIRRGRKTKGDSAPWNALLSREYTGCDWQSQGTYAFFIGSRSRLSAGELEYRLARVRKSSFA